MAAFWTYLAWVSLAAWCVLPALWWWWMRRLPKLRPDGAADGGLLGAVSSSRPPTDAPGLAIVVAARDEAGSAREAAAWVAAARAWLTLDHPALEIVVVDDRSSDATADVLRLALAGDPRARVAPRLPHGAGALARPPLPGGRAARRDAGGRRPRSGGGTRANAAALNGSVELDPHR